ncbi:hypothetical protein TWF281_006054 [Arthrobotrys megalospora]
MKSFIVILMAVPAILAAAVPAELKAREHCPSTSVISSCWGECKSTGYPTDACYNCCYNTCRPCKKR